MHRGFEAAGVTRCVVAGLAGDLVDDPLDHVPNGLAGGWERPPQFGQDSQRVGADKRPVGQVDPDHTTAVQGSADLLHPATELVGADGGARGRTEQSVGCDRARGLVRLMPKRIGLCHVSAQPGR